MSINLMMHVCAAMAFFTVIYTWHWYTCTDRQLTCKEPDLMIIDIIKAGYYLKRFGVLLTDITSSSFDS